MSWVESEIDPNIETFPIPTHSRELLQFLFCFARFLSFVFFEDQAINLKTIVFSAYES